MYIFINFLKYIKTIKIFLKIFKKKTALDMFFLSFLTMIDL
jgi:hypothetical protein